MSSSTLGWGRIFGKDRHTVNITQFSYAKLGEDSDLSLEVVILLIFGVFMCLFGLLLFSIHSGELPYTPDSMIESQADGFRGSQLE